MSALVDCIRRDGYVMPQVATGIAARLLETLMQSYAYTGHVITQGDRVARSFSDAMAQPHGFVSHHMATTLSTPGLFNLIAGFHSVAAEYFGEEPMLYSVNAFWKKPSGAPGWHHDTDDGPKQLVCFMYGTDVLTDDDGIHQYVTGSHLWSLEKKFPHHNVQEDVSGPLPSDWPRYTFKGNAGTIFLTDTRGLHNGFPPKHNPRLLLWARWTAPDIPISYRNDEIVPVPWRRVTQMKPSEEIQRRTRLVVNWDRP